MNLYRRSRLIAGAIGKWDESRTRASAHAAQRKLVQEFRKADLSGTCYTMLQRWVAVTNDLRRCCAGGIFAKRFCNTALIERVWNRWLHVTGTSAASGHALRLLGTVHSLRFTRHAFQRWWQWCMCKTRTRHATLNFMMYRVQQCATMVVRSWALVTQEAVAVDTRHMLKVDDVRSRSRKKLCCTVVTCWHSQAAQARDAARKVRLTKVFACWRLHSQEQVLLRKYMQECSMARFTSNSENEQTCLPGSVQPSDFECLYKQMAAHHWSTLDLWLD